MSSWKVSVSSRAQSQLAALGKGIRSAVIKKLESLRNYPKQRGKYFSDKDVYSLRIGTPGGEYRAIYRIKEEQNVVLIILVAPREEVYEILDRIL